MWEVVFRLSTNRYMTLSTARSILQAFNYSSTSTGWKRLLIHGVWFRQTLFSIQKLIIWLLQLYQWIYTVRGIDQTFMLIPRTLLGIKLLIIRIANVPFWIAHILGYILRQSLLNQQVRRQNGFLPILFLLLRLTLMRSLILHYMLQVIQFWQIPQELSTLSTSRSSLKFVDKNSSSDQNILR